MARLVSYAVNPLVFPPLVYGTVLAHVGAPGVDVVWGVGIAVVFLGGIPLLYVGAMRLQGRIASLEIRDRTKRTEPFLVVLGAGGAALATVLGMEMTGRCLLAALVGCHVLNTGVLFLITTRWKISVHCAAAAGAVATLAFVRGHVPGTVMGTLWGHGLLGGGVVLVLLTAWARIRSRAHTQAQVAAGTGLGVVAPYAELLALSATVGL